MEAPLRPFLDGLVACATSVGPRSSQQDSCLYGSFPGSKLVVVADGVGISPSSHIIASNAAIQAAQFFQQLALSGQPVCEESIRSCCKTVHRVCQRLNEQIEAQGQMRGGTTLLIGIETDDCFIAGAVGDGAIGFLAGNGDVSDNLILEPAIAEQVGDTAEDVHPQIVSIPKLRQSGYCLMIASDGIKTAIDIPGEPSRPEHEMRTLSLITQELDYLLAQPNYPDDGSIQRMLETWVRGEVREIGDGQVIHPSHDNRSIGLLADQAFIDVRRRNGQAALRG